MYFPFLANTIHVAAGTVGRQQSFSMCAQGQHFDFSLELSVYFICILFNPVCCRILSIPTIVIQNFLLVVQRDGPRTSVCGALVGVGIGGWEE